MKEFAAQTKSHFTPLFPYTEAIIFLNKQHLHLGIPFFPLLDCKFQLNKPQLIIFSLPRM